MRKYILFIFLLSFSLLAHAQKLKYFVLDTASSYNIIKMTAKNEIPWPMQSGSMWHWKKERQLTENVEKHVFQVSFQGVDWKQIPALTKIGVFFCFDKAYRIIYLHFFIPKGLFSEEELVRLEGNFRTYARLFKEFDLSPHLYTDDPATFKRGIGRFSLIRKGSPLWNEE